METIAPVEDGTVPQGNVLSARQNDKTNKIMEMKILEIFRETRGNDVKVDKTRGFGIENYIPSLSDSPSLLPKQSRLLAEMRHILFIITRSKNANTVVYRFKSSDEPVEAFWQRFEESPDDFADEIHLRKELSWIQRKLAYGISTKPVQGSDTYSATLVACPGFPMTLTRDSFGTYRILLTIDNSECYLLRIHVDARENIIGLPTVVFTNIHAIDISTGKEVIAKVKP